MVVLLVCIERARTGEEGFLTVYELQDGVGDQQCVSRCSSRFERGMGLYEVSMPRRLKVTGLRAS